MTTQHINKKAIKNPAGSITLKNNKHWGNYIWNGKI